MTDGLAARDNPGLKVKQLRPGDWSWICHELKPCGNRAMIARANLRPVDNPPFTAADLWKTLFEHLSCRV
jgi:hypothetical protein